MKISINEGDASVVATEDGVTIFTTQDRINPLDLEITKIRGVISINSNGIDYVNKEKKARGTIILQGKGSHVRVDLP